MSPKPRDTFRLTEEGDAYGRVTSYPTAEAFLIARYDYGAGWPDSKVEQDGDGNVFDGYWKIKHPLVAYIKAEAPNVRRGWYRFTPMKGGGLYLHFSNANTSGAFELWQLPYTPSSSPVLPKEVRA